MDGKSNAIRDRITTVKNTKKITEVRTFNVSLHHDGTENLYVMRSKFGHGAGFLFPARFLGVHSRTWGHGF